MNEPLCTLASTEFRRPVNRPFWFAILLLAAGIPTAVIASFPPHAAPPSDTPIIVDLVPPGGIVDLPPDAMCLPKSERCPDVLSPKPALVGERLGGKVVDLWMTDARVVHEIRELDGWVGFGLPMDPDKRDPVDLDPCVRLSTGSRTIPPRCGDTDGYTAIRLGGDTVQTRGMRNEFGVSPGFITYALAPLALKEQILLHLNSEAATLNSLLEFPR